MPPLELVTSTAYPLFYTLAVAIAGWTMFHEGQRRGWAAGSWGVAVAAWLAAGVLGAMLPHVIFGDAVAPRTSIGAIVLATVVLAVIAPALRRSPTDALDTTAVAIPLGAAVVRIGCFLAECCRGAVTALPIGVALHPEDEPRHATQLYEAGLEVLLALAITRRTAWSRPGERILASMAGMTTIRFFTEFLRDNEKYGGLSLAQWVVLPLGMACVSALVSRDAASVRRCAATAAARPTAIVLAVTLGIIGLALELPALEQTVLLLCLVVALITAARRIAPAGATVLALQVPALSADTTHPRSFLFYGAGATGGAFDKYHRAGNCDGTTEEWNRHYSFSGLAAEIGTYREESPTRGGGLRARGYYGSTRVGQATVIVGSPSHAGAHTLHDVGVTLAGDVDWRYVGISGGASIGNFHPMGETAENGQRDEEATSLFPLIGIRLGPKVGISGEIRIGDEAPTWSPGPAFTGTLSVGGRNGNRVRVGASDVGPFIGGRIVTPQGIEVLPSVNIGPSSDWGVSNLRQLSITVRKWVRTSNVP